MSLLSCCPFSKTTVNLFIKTRTKGKSGCRSVVKNIKNADLELKENQAIEAWLKILKTRIRKYVRSCGHYYGYMHPLAVIRLVLFQGKLEAFNLMLQDGSFIQLFQSPGTLRDLADEICPC